MFCMESVTLLVASMTFFVELLPFKIWEKTIKSLVESLHIEVGISTISITWETVGIVTWNHLL